jgi:putative radical SAM enzyme (TIGR03279 family)
MSLPRVVAVVPGSPADLAGLTVGDEIVSVNGVAPRDVIEYRLLTDEPDPELELRRGGLDLAITAEKEMGVALGVEVSSALFDRVRTCDNHCEFCFIYQLPPNLRKSLYVKDDDYRLSFLYGNFTTLTRFTEADLERVVSEGLGPLHVSIHTTDPELRARMLRNRRGATSLRWLRALLDHGVEVHGQLVICPEVNDGVELDRTLAGVMDRFPELASVAAVPLGVSRWSKESAMRPHTTEEAVEVCRLVDFWQEAFLQAIGRRMVFAADEYYLLAGRPFPAAEDYEDFSQHENGVGMARAFLCDLTGAPRSRDGEKASGFFASVDGAPAEGYRAPRLIPVADGSAPVGAPCGATPQVSSKGMAVSAGGPMTLLTGSYGAAVLTQGLSELGIDEVEVRPVENRFFGGNIGVAGLLAGEDVARELAALPADARALLPDSCLSGGRFLDGMELGELPRPVEVVGADGESLRRALGLAAA